MRFRGASTGGGESNLGLDRRKQGSQRGHGEYMYIACHLLRVG